MNNINSVELSFVESFQSILKDSAMVIPEILCMEFNMTMPTMVENFRKMGFFAEEAENDEEGNAVIFASSQKHLDNALNGGDIILIERITHALIN